MMVVFVSISYRRMNTEDTDKMLMNVWTEKRYNKGGMEEIILGALRFVSISVSE
jgi:hypothetical protein